MRCICKRHPVFVDIHTVDTGNDRWDCHYNCNRRQIFHNVIQAVIQQRGHQLSGSVDDISVDGCHFDRLTVLHYHIIQKFLIFRVLLQPFIACQPVKHYPICPERCRKVDQRGFQFVQVDQIRIVCIASDTFFYLSTSFIDDPEICLINCCLSGTGSDTQNEASSLC